MTELTVPRRFAPPSKQVVLGAGITVELYQPQAHAHLPEHEHPVPCLNLLLDGGLCESRGQQHFELSRGALSLLPAGVSHQIMVAARPASVLHIEFGDQFIRRLPLNLRSPLPGLWLQDQTTHSLALRFRQEMQRVDSLSSLAFEALAIEALLHLLRQSDNRRPGVPDWLDQLVRQWQSDPAQAVRVQDLARQYGLSPSALARIFKRHFGHSIVDHLLELRIAEACTAMRGATIALASLTTRLGFADQSHFTRVFRRIVGLTPSAWRAQQRASGSGRL